MRLGCISVSQAFAMSRKARRGSDDEGEVLDLVIQRRRDADAALKLLGRVLRNQTIKP